VLDLYFFPTPNSRKVTILLEECGLPYKLKIVNIGRGDQFDPNFLRISPNNRMPALVDHDPVGGGKPIAIFESGAMMMYIAEKAEKFWPQQPAVKYEVVQWIMWQMANQGPKMGEQGHFERADKEQRHGDLSYPINRFDNEVHRLFGVLNLGLHKKKWLAAGEYTIADMICYPWAKLWRSRGIDMMEFPNVAPWLETIAARPAVQRTAEIGKDIYQGPDAMPEDIREKFTKMLANQRAVPVPAEWDS
jgi:GSH-dependent disulfide-bond oxidoreductase